MNLFRRNDLRLHGALIRNVLVDKCEAKGVEVPTYDSVAAAPHRAERLPPQGCQRLDRRPDIGQNSDP